MPRLGKHPIDIAANNPRPKVKGRVGRNPRCDRGLDGARVRNGCTVKLQIRAYNQTISASA